MKMLQAARRSGAGTLRRLLACLCVLACMLSMTASVWAAETPAEASVETPAADQTEQLLAQPSSQPLYVMTSDGRELEVTKPLPIYNINSSNYMKIQDVGYILDFQVEYDMETGAVSVLTNRHSDGAGVSVGAAYENAWAELSGQSLYVDGVQAEGLTMYSINDSYYVKLRDLAQAVNFGCCYSSRLKAIVISAAFHYSENNVMTEGSERRITYTGGEILMDSTVGRDARDYVGDFSVSLMTTELTMRRNADARVYASVVCDAEYQVQWTSSDPAVVDVDELGYLYSRKTGEVDIIFSVTANGQTETKVCHVTVVESGADVPLEPDCHAMAAELLALINDKRQNINPDATVLQFSASLQRSAQTRAMELSDLYGHQRPDGNTFMTVIDDDSIAGAEELIMRGVFTPEEVLAVWMGSSRGTLLGNNVTIAGVGCYADWDHYSICWNLILARQSDSDSK